MFHKFRVLPGLCMFFLLFQFENTPGTTFLLDTRRNAEKKVGFETPSFSCAYFWELKFDPGGEEKEEEEGTERWGSFFSEETIYRSWFLEDLSFFGKSSHLTWLYVHNSFFLNDIFFQENSLGESKRDWPTTFHQLSRLKTRLAPALPGKLWDPDTCGFQGRAKLKRKRRQGIFA